MWPQECVRVFPPGAEEEIVTGQVYTDGAMRGRLTQARRSGWAFAIVEPQTLQLVVAYYGHCGGPWHSVIRAELQAIEQALARAVEPLVIHTDSQVAVSAFTEGKEYCCSAKSEGAEIWSRIWARLEDFGSFQLRKVKAHTTSEDVAEGLIGEFEQAGNAAADFFAVQARTMAQRCSPVDDFERHYARARSWYNLDFRATGSWKNDTVADVEQQSGNAHQQMRTRRPQSDMQRHEVWELPAGFMCRICGRRFGLADSPEAVSKKRCLGPMRARLLSSIGALPVYARFAHTAAELLRAGAVRWRTAQLPEDSAAAGTANVSRDAAVNAAQETGPPPRPLNIAVRRRLTGKQPDPLQKMGVLKESATGHLLAVRGRLTYCERCGRWAIDRMSTALAKRCAGTVDTVRGSYRIRRSRMREGRHPLTNRPL